MTKSSGDDAHDFGLYDRALGARKAVLADDGASDEMKKYA